MKENNLFNGMDEVFMIMINCIKDNYISFEKHLTNEPTLCEG